MLVSTFCMYICNIIYFWDFPSIESNSFALFLSGCTLQTGGPQEIFYQW